MKKKYYSLNNLMKTAPDALYYVIYGERSNGKTFSVESLILYGIHERGIDVPGYLDDGRQGVILRRWMEDFRGGNSARMWSPLIENEIDGKLLEKKSGGKWNGVTYKSRTWHLAHFDEDGNKDDEDETPFAYATSLTQEERDKSTSYPKVKTILFDEFLTRGMYLPDEFVTFTNVLSTIIRDRGDVKIFLCGNTVTQYCPYFQEMGLTRIKQQKKGTIDVYQYGDSDLTVAVEYSDFPAKKKKSDKYFAFENPKLKMITAGAWEMDIYPHAPFKIKAEDVKGCFVLEFDGERLQGDFVLHDHSRILYIHRKTSEIKNDGKTLVISPDWHPEARYCRNLLRQPGYIWESIRWYFASQKVFYQDNSVGEVVRAYFNWAKTLDQ